MSIFRSLRVSLISLGCAALVMTGCDKDEGDDGNNSSAGETGTASGETADPTGDPSGDPTGDSADETGGSNNCEVEDDCPMYTECAQTMCASEYEQCLGAGYMNGNFSGGACEDFMTCSNACDCEDDACLMDCNNMHFAGDCSDCLINVVGACVGANCIDQLCQ